MDFARYRTPACADGNVIETHDHKGDFKEW
jgi:hypothetical protein